MKKWQKAAIAASTIGTVGIGLVVMFMNGAKINRAPELIPGNHDDDENHYHSIKAKNGNRSLEVTSKGWRICYEGENQSDTVKLSDWPNGHFAIGVIKHDDKHCLLFFEQDKNESYFSNDPEALYQKFGPAKHMFVLSNSFAGSHVSSRTNDIKFLTKNPVAYSAIKVFRNKFNNISLLALDKINNTIDLINANDCKILKEADTDANDILDFDLVNGYLIEKHEGYFLATRLDVYSSHYSHSSKSKYETTFGEPSLDDFAEFIVKGFEKDAFFFKSIT